MNNQRPGAVHVNSYDAVPTCGAYSEGQDVYDPRIRCIVRLKNHIFPIYLFPPLLIVVHVGGVIMPSIFSRTLNGSCKHTEKNCLGMRGILLSFNTNREIASTRFHRECPANSAHMP